MMIHVTDEDIEQGKANEPRDCPVALALKRELRKRLVPYEIVDLSVQFKGVEITVPEDDDDWSGAPQITTPLPQSAQDFIDQFDDWDEGLDPIWRPSPFTFELGIPELVAE